MRDEGGEQGGERRGRWERRTRLLSLMLVELDTTQSHNNYIVHFFTSLMQALHAQQAKGKVSKSKMLENSCSEYENTLITYIYLNQPLLHLLISLISLNFLIYINIFIYLNFLNYIIYLNYSSTSSTSIHFLSTSNSLSIHF